MAYTKLVVNCETGVTEEMEMTSEEITAYETAAEATAQLLIEEKAAAEALAALKASAKAKLVAGTPLTEAEAATIVL